MRSEPARLGGISLDFARIPPRWDENFPYEHAQVGPPGKVVRAFVLHNSFTSPYCKKYLIKQSFSSDINFLIELR